MKMYSLLGLLLVVQLLAFSMWKTSMTSPQSTPTPTPQQSPTPPRAAPAGEDDVVRITTKLVQVDAVITDRNGKLVTDLRPEEVRILEDGRPQKITHFSLVTADNVSGLRGVVIPATSAKTSDRNAPPAPPVTLRPEDVRRSMALVVDDLGLSAESIFYVRRALKKFVDEEMQPSDLVAIIRTGSGIGALQQFTSDKRMLYAAIERVKWNPMGYGDLSAMGPITGDPLAEAVPPQLAAAHESATKSAEGSRKGFLLEETLHSIRYVVDGLKDLPGRKSILLISDGLDLGPPEDRGASSRMEPALKLIDHANRGSVVIYALDVRGLQTLALTAADSPRVTSAITGNAANGKPGDLLQIERPLSARRVDFRKSQEGLIYLTEETGGLAFINNNDLSKGIRSVLNDQQSYYLIGYRPDESTFDAKTGRRKFHSLTIKVTRPGKFIVRMRKGFYGVTDEEVQAVAKTAEQQVIKALTSPFGAAGVQVRLTSLFGNDESRGSFLSTLLHVRASDLTFTDEADGWHRAEFDIVAVTFGDNGSVVDQVGRTHSIKVRGNTYQHMMKEGFVYMVMVPIKKPGAYQLRVALRDHGSERVGSANQFVEVPDIKSDRLLLSGVLVTGIDPAALKKTGAGAASTPSNPLSSSGAQDRSAEDPEVMDPTNSAAVREFHRGQYVQYGVVIYNAQLDKATGRPQLRINVRLFRDSNPVFTGEPLEVNAANAPDLKRVAATGAIQLGTALVPGEYVLQVIVTDLLADPKHRTATHWIDFELVK